MIATVVTRPDGTYTVDVIGAVYFGNGRSGLGFIRSVPCADRAAADEYAAFVNARSAPGTRFPPPTRPHPVG